MSERIQIYNLRDFKTLTVYGQPEVAVLRIVIKETEIHLGLTVAELEIFARQLLADAALLSEPPETRVC